MSGLMRNVSAVGPLGESIDGTKRTRTRRAASPIASRNGALAASWVCTACGRRTDNAEDQARHLAAELMEARARLSRIAIDSAELAEALPEYVQRVSPARLGLSDEDARRAWAVQRRLTKQGQAVPDEVADAAREYHRRKTRRQRARASAA